MLVSHIGSGRFNHPDILHFPPDSKLGIEQARKIKEHFSFRSYQSKGKAVVLEDASVLTIEAQNALLKTLEEPPASAVLILGASSEAKFLPTILSRCKIIHIKNPTSHRNPTSEVGYEKDIEQLLQATTGERFEYIEKLKEKDEFLKVLVHYFHQNLPSHIGSGNTKFIKELLQAEEYVNQNVNIRAILEYLMLVMPGKE